MDIVKLVQRSTFQQEIKCLIKNDKSVKNTHKKVVPEVQRKSRSSSGTIKPFTRLCVKERFNGCLILRLSVTWEEFGKGLSDQYAKFSEDSEDNYIVCAILKEQMVDDETLLTVMTHVEAILNSCPLTTCIDDPADENPLTPNQILLMRKETNLPPGVKDDSYGRRWCQAQYVADQFFWRWLRE